MATLCPGVPSRSSDVHPFHKSCRVPSLPTPGPNRQPRKHFLCVHLPPSRSHSCFFTLTSPTHRPGTCLASLFLPHQLYSRSNTRSLTAYIIPIVAKGLFVSCDSRQSLSAPETNHNCPLRRTKVLVAIQTTVSDRIISTPSFEDS